MTLQRKVPGNKKAKPVLVWPLVLWWKNLPNLKVCPSGQSHNPTRKHSGTVGLGHKYSKGRRVNKINMNESETDTKLLPWPINTGHFDTVLTLKKKSLKRSKCHSSAKWRLTVKIIYSKINEAMSSLYFGLHVFCLFEAREPEFDTQPKPFPPIAVKVFSVQCTLNTESNFGTLA